MFDTSILAYSTLSFFFSSLFFTAKAIMKCIQTGCQEWHVGVDCPHSCRTAMCACSLTAENIIIYICVTDFALDGSNARRRIPSVGATDPPHAAFIVYLVGRFPQVSKSQTGRRCTELSVSSMPPSCLHVPTGRKNE